MDITILDLLDEILETAAGLLSDANDENLDYRQGVVAMATSMLLPEGLGGSKEAAEKLVTHAIVGKLEEMSGE